MKAYTTAGDGIGALRLEERPAPEPGRGEVLVKMTAASLNFRDMLVVEGFGRWKPRRPRVPVSDGVGVVVAAGRDVSRFGPGDRVAGLFLPKWLDGELTPEKDVAPLGGPELDGVLSEYRVFDEQAVVAVPSHLTDAEAATLPVAALTAWHAVARRSRVGEGDTVLIQGTGGVSLFALQFVRALGGRPIVTSSSDEKLERAKSLGAAATINYRKFPEWEEQVLELTRGGGVDHVIEVVGGENLNRSLRAVKLSGTISFIGLLGGRSAVVNVYEFVGKNVQIHGVETGSREMFEEMSRFIEAHGLRPVIDRTYGFSESPQAMAYLKSRAHFGKVAITF